ncbi:hypothetical protein [Rhodococcus sp. X156]|uniref:hypothetical protein n=1 Tax=Rhodococcus sp. X156 TaxID=2499145 RepID=UPI000FDAF7F8|nr:hypothetical protein [Rhodococcus sp. X156]
MRIPRRPVRYLVAALAVLFAAALVPVFVHAERQPLDGPWQPTFDMGRSLVTNEVAHRSPRRPGAVTSPDWIVTSGSLFADGGRAWSGYPDDASPDVSSSRGTGSAVLRAVSRPDHFADVRFHLSLEVAAPTTSARTGMHSWDGVHLFVRYTSPSQLYAVTVCRRDGTTAIKKKAPTAGAPASGRYTTMASGSLPCTVGRPVDVDVDVRNAADGVHVALLVNGAPVLSAVDSGQDGTPALTGPGRVGVRGDNTELRFGSVTVSKAS